MKILILGVSGMLGHKMYQTLSRHFRKVYGTVRGSKEDYKHFDIFNPDQLIDGVDVRNFVELTSILKGLRPDVIVNCIGVTTRKLDRTPTSEVIYTNGVLPHQLNEWSTSHKARLIHFSTDCVFTGSQGDYTEESPVDATDVYGRSKALGEVNGPHCLTIRSSIIGRELRGHTELVEWFLSQKKKTVKGYSEVIYSGVTTQYMAALVSHLITDHLQVDGLYQVSSPKISKFELLNSLNEAFKVGAQVEPDPSYVSNKSLQSNRFFAKTGLIPPDWPTMIEQMKLDPTPYEKWRAA